MDFNFAFVCACLLTLANASEFKTQASNFSNCGFNMSATCDDVMWLFADGDLLVANASDWEVTSEVHIPANTKVIEIHCLDSWIHGGILASSDNGLITDGAWNCSSDNRNTWNPAYLLGRNGETAKNISKEAIWIWTDMSNWMQTQQRRHTKAICKIELEASQCESETTTPIPTTTTTIRTTTPIPPCPPFSEPVQTTIPIPTTTTTTPRKPKPGFNLTATCDSDMKLFVDGNLVATSSNWRNTSKVIILANTEAVEIHCMDNGINGGILASIDNGLLSDGAWNCSSDNGKTWSPAYEVGPNGEAVPDISPEAEWIWTGCIGDWTSKYTGKKLLKNVICKIDLKPVIDGGWSAWSVFSSCSTSCGDATKRRTRTCSNPSPSNGGELCQGSDEEVVSCGLSPCYGQSCSYTDKYKDCPKWKNYCKSGQWTECMNENCPKTCKCDCSPWSRWSECSATCGIAAKTRKRKCPPMSSRKGKSPRFVTEEVASCHLPSCGAYIQQKCFLEDTKITFLDLGHNHMHQDQPPVWKIADNGRSLTETLNTRPSIGLSNLGDVTEPVSFSGRVFSASPDNDVIGMVFGFWNETNFFVIASARQRINPTNWYVARLHATCGMSCASTTTISDAIWYPLSHPKDITVLATGNTPWQHGKEYNFTVCFNPLELLLSVTVTNENEEGSILESGIISAKTNDSEVDEVSRKGGFVGVYVDSQAQTTWDYLVCQDCHLIDPPTFKDSIYFIAGGLRTERDIEFYDPTMSNLSCSISPPPLNNDWYHHITFYYNNTIHLCGGYFGTASTCISYNPNTKEWKTHILTTSRSHGYSTTILNKRVYIVGGKDTSNIYIGAESTPLPLTDQPVLTPVLNLDYKGFHQCTTKVDEDTLVVTGGHNRKYLSSVIEYNAKSHTTTSLPSLKQPRYNHGCAVVEMDNTQTIIVAGGYNSADKCLKTTEILQIGRSSWTYLGDLNVARHGHSIVVTERGVMAMGGVSGSGYLSSVELLDWSAKSWRIVEPSLSKSRYEFGGAMEIPASMFDCQAEISSTTTTTATTTTESIDNGTECNSYTAITDSWRKIDYNNRGKERAHCDNKMVKKWYRFEGEAGSKLPTEKAPTGFPTSSSMICGTHRTSWMTSSHPTPEDQIVTRKVCFEWDISECAAATNIRVRACYNNDKSIYYVYELGPSGAGCYNGYCALPEEGHQSIFISARASSQLESNNHCWGGGAKCIWGPHFAIDGELQISYGKIFHSNREKYPWFEVELSHSTKLYSVTIFNRPDCCGERFKNAEIRAGLSRVPDGTTGQLLSINTVCGTYRGPGANGEQMHINCASPIMAKFVTVQLEDIDTTLQINEIRINTINEGVLSLSSQYVNSQNEDFTASKCLDGDLNTMCHTTNEKYPYLVMEYPNEVLVKKVKVVARADGRGANRVKQLVVSVTNVKPTRGQLVSGGKTLGTFTGPASPSQEIMFKSEAGLRGKYVVIQQGYTGIINYAEIEITKETPGQQQQQRRIPGKRRQSSPKLAEQESFNIFKKQSERRSSIKQSLPEQPAEQGDSKLISLPIQTGKRIRFQLKGKIGIEKVKISVDDTEEEFVLTTEWRIFSYPRPTSGSFSVEFMNDIGYTDVFIRGHESQVTDLLPNFPANKFLGCGTKNEDEKCGILRKGTLMWNGKYTYNLKGQ